MIGFRSDKNMKVLIIKSWTIFSKKTRFDQSEEVLLLQQFITSPRVVVNVFLIVVAIIITILPTVSHMSAACHYNSTLSPADPHQHCLPPRCNHYFCFFPIWFSFVSFHRAKFGICPHFSCIPKVGANMKWKLRQWTTFETFSVNSWSVQSYHTEWLKGLLFWILRLTSKDITPLQ